MADELMSRKETREKAKSPIPSSLLFYSPLNSWVELMRFYGGISYLMYLQHFFFHFFLKGNQRRSYLTSFANKTVAEKSANAQRFLSCLLLLSCKTGIYARQTCGVDLMIIGTPIVTHRLQKLN